MRAARTIPAASDSGTPSQVTRGGPDIAIDGCGQGVFAGPRVNECIDLTKKPLPARLPQDEQREAPARLWLVPDWLPRGKPLTLDGDPDLARAPCCSTSPPASAATASVSPASSPARRQGHAGQHLRHSSSPLPACASAESVAGPEPLKDRERGKVLGCREPRLGCHPGECSRPLGGWRLKDRW